MKIKKKKYFEGEVVVHKGDFALITKIKKVIKKSKPMYKYSIVYTDSGKEDIFYEEAS